MEFVNCFTDERGAYWNRGADGSVHVVSAAEFQNGFAAALLHHSEGGGIWGQDVAGGDAYPRFTSVQPTVNVAFFNLNGGGLEGDTYVKYTGAETDAEFPVPSMDYHDFLGWYDNAKLEGTAITKFDNGESGVKELYAKWAWTEYTLKFISDGKEVSTDNATSYTYATETFELKGFEKTGYDFNGWEVRPMYGRNYVVDEIEQGSTGALTLYAKWTPTEYSITYMANGEEYNERYYNSYTIESETITLWDINTAGYDFGGWYEDAEFTTEVTEVPKGSTGDKTFYAKLTPTVYTITYMSDGEEISTEKPVTYTIESKTFKLMVPVKENYVFLGWRTKDRPNYETIFEIPQGSCDVTELYATWKPILYKVAFVDEDGETELAPVMYYIQGTLPEDIDAPVATKESNGADRYVFAGWDKDLAVVTEDVTYKATYAKVTSSSSTKQESSSSATNPASSSSSTKGESSSSVIPSAAEGSSSSAKPASSSSATQSANSSSSAKGGSSSSVILSDAEGSSSSATQSASSSSEAEDKSSSSKKTESVVAAVTVPQFSLSVAGRNVQIAGARVGSAFAVLDMQGRVMETGRVNAANFNVVMPHAGSFIIRIGNYSQRLTVK